MTMGEIEAGDDSVKVEEEPAAEGTDSHNTKTPAEAADQVVNQHDAPEETSETQALTDNTDKNTELTDIPLDANTQEEGQAPSEIPAEDSTKEEQSEGVQLEARLEGTVVVAHAQEAQNAVVEPLMVNGDNKDDVEQGGGQKRSGFRCSRAQGQKWMMRMFRRREVVFCLIGAVTFLIGLIMIIVALLIMQDRCDQQWNCSEQLNGQVVGREQSLVNQYGHFNHHEAPYVIDLLNQTEDSTLNLAEGQAASQSSTWMASDGGIHNSSLAVDGNQNNRAEQGMCSQTDFQTRPYWYVDLGEVHHINRVKLVIPGDCCLGDLHDFELRVGEHEDFERNMLCKHFMGTALQVSVDITCDRPLYGRFVSVQMLGDDARKKDRLTLCEVLVYSP